MFDTMIHWLNTIPLGEPWRALVLVGAVLTFTLILHGLWELGFKLGRRGRPASK
jgi:hypothetical protein